MCFGYVREDFSLKIEGRADGIFTDGDLTVIDEIKGVYLPVQDLEKPLFIHQAQAMCYAYIVAENENLDEIGVQLTYCHLETEQEVRFRETFSRIEIVQWFRNLMDEYEKWAVYQYDWKKQRDASITELTFPFSYRPGQKELAAMVYHTVEKGKRLFVEAPTGVGKTISTVFPAIKAMGEEVCDRIFYLTAKTITGTVAREAFELLRKGGYQAKIIQITAKEKLCMCDEMECNPVHCP